MKIQYLYLLSLLLVFTCQKEKEVSAPLFIDPNYHGSCDPEVVWNESTEKYYIYYTARRSQIQDNFIRTPIGVISSPDLVNWHFEDYCAFDGKDNTKDANATYWAPAIIAHNDTLHMFVTYKADTTTEKGPWGGPAMIVHYKAPESNPINGWQKVEIMHELNMSTIDATVYERDAEFHLWFKGKVKGNKKNKLYHKVSTDLYKWEDRGFSKSDVFNKSLTGYGFEEAPYIFEWKGLHWLITDPHDGLLVYNSSNSEHWTYQGKILKKGGKRSMDNTMARHCSVMVKDERAFIFYHLEPWRKYKDDYPQGQEVPIYKQPTKHRLSVLQMAELEYVDGAIKCDRDKVIQD